jgi:hypothetical protein
LLKLGRWFADCVGEVPFMLMWFVLAAAGVLLAGVFTVLRRKSESATNFGEPGAQAVKLGRLY